MAEPEDANLVARVVAGDRRAFRDLVDRHAGRVHRLCYCLLRHHQDAEDAAQETFLRAYGAMSRVDPNRSFTNWLLKIAANLCRDRLRRRRRDLRLVDPARLPDAVAAAAGPTVAPPPPAVLLDAVARAVAALEPDYREVFHLYHREGRSYAEMAAILGRPIGTIKTQLHRARRRVLGIVEGTARGGPVGTLLVQETGRGGRL